ncbi:MAG TPA: hypothetical protein VD793_03400 [Gemmatimonadales bacterium]|nr:hypothetical protein [Gemmatimonadales bacterium]
MNRFTCRSASCYRLARAAAAALTLGRAAGVAAQEHRPPLPATPPRFTATTESTPDLRPAWLAPLASALVPGTGQLLAGQDRGALYLVVETYLAARFMSEHREARAQTERYRDLAFQIARQAYGPATRDTVFGYFEEMGKYIESGPFDTDPDAPLVPPADEQTFNGRIWRLARETFFPHPDSLPNPGSEEYQRALEFYRNRAVTEEFRWSWRGAALEHDLFRQTIRASDRAFRAATQHLGALLANHVVSIIDAFVAQRLAPNGTVRVSGSLARARENAERTGLTVAVALRARF